MIGVFPNQQVDSLASVAGTQPKVGLLISGAESPGLHAAVRAITKTAIHALGIEVWEIENGFQGLIDDHTRRLDEEDVTGPIPSKSVLNSCDKRACDDRSGASDPAADVTSLCLSRIRAHAFEALLVIGNTASLAAALQLSRQGIRCVGIPKSIENDVLGTDISFGFATAVATATELMDRVRSHSAQRRVMVVEVAGRNAGWIALHAGVAVGAEAILIPEIPFDIETVYRMLGDPHRSGRRSGLICAAEGALPRQGTKGLGYVGAIQTEKVGTAGIGRWLAGRLGAMTGMKSRAVVLGQTLRHAMPVAADRVLAAQLGHAAVKLLARGGSGRLIVMHGGTVSDIDMQEAVRTRRVVPRLLPLLQAAREMGICLGD